MTQDQDTLLINPREYFKGEVNRASKSLKVCLGEEMEFYVVNLLCDFINPQKINESMGDESILGTPLAMLMKKAHEAEYDDQKITTFKRLGDASLYIAGYFQDYFNRKTFDIKYYIDMGSIAYGSVSNLIRKRKDQETVYSELSDHFSQLVDLVAEVSEDSRMGTKDSNILSIYDRWNRTNSARLRKILEEAGIDPVSTPIKLAQ